MEDARAGYTAALEIYGALGNSQRTPRLRAHSTSCLVDAIRRVAPWNAQRDLAATTAAAAKLAVTRILAVA